MQTITTKHNESQLNPEKVPKRLFLIIVLAFFSASAFAEAPTKITLQFNEGDIPTESIGVAHKLLSESLPVSLSSGSDGDIKCTVKRLNWFDMLDHNPWLSPRVRAIVIDGTCDIILVKGENNPQMIGNVLAHEIGHALGADHNKQRGSIMNEFLEYDKSYKFTVRDLGAINLQDSLIASIPR